MFAPRLSCREQNTHRLMFQKNNKTAHNYSHCSRVPSGILVQRDEQDEELQEAFLTFCATDGDDSRERVHGADKPTQHPLQ